MSSLMLGHTQVRRELWRLLISGISTMRLITRKNGGLFSGTDAVWTDTAADGTQLDAVNDCKRDGHR